MAQIRLHVNNKRIETQEEVSAFLANNEVIYENWDITKLPENLREKYDLTDEEKTEILNAFGEDIKDISERRGYKAQDVISLSESTPNIDE
ncbi:acireductone dioxygenase, partial [Priestia megaterium]